MRQRHFTGLPAVQPELAETISDPALKQSMGDDRQIAIGQPAAVDVNEILIRPTARPT